MAAEKGRLKSHKDLDLWQTAMDLTEEVYSITAGFPREEIYGLSLQTRRCAVSIPSNIAEGAARTSTKEFAQFLSVALGSVAELETQLILATRMGCMPHSGVLERLDRVRKMVLGLLHFLRRKSGTKYLSRVTRHE